MSDTEQIVRPDSSHPYLPGRQPACPLLRALSGPLEGRESSPTSDRYTAGRDPQSDIVIAHPEVFRRHAGIARMAREYLPTDRKSANGVYVNNLKLDRAVLHHGDVLQIGSRVVRFVWNRSKASAR
ncbi:MAG TPA: FHA domain-containing protein [Nitrospiria bacterium]|nr:FHA domain-containing protein [Nitrospiria bacterium]